LVQKKTETNKKGSLKRESFDDEILYRLLSDDGPEWGHCSQKYGTIK
jgi:hypothetical protein